MATTYDPNKDYSKAIEAAKASGQDTTQLEKERAAKIADKYGGVEPTMYGSDKTYSQLSGSNGSWQNQDVISNAINISNTTQNNAIKQQMEQAAQAGDWDKVGSLANGLAVPNGRYGGQDLTYVNQAWNEVAQKYGYNAKNYYDQRYDEAYGAGSAAVWDATGGAIKSYQALVDSVGADKALQFLTEAQQGTPTKTQLPDLEQIYGYGNYGSDAPVYQGSEWDSVLDALAQQLVNMNYADWTKGDQYQALADRYGQQGRMSMQDVLGQISSRTGGLASSWAQTSANQQYNSFMSQLEDAAMEMYGVELNDLYDRANMARQYAQDDYNRYVDDWNRWADDRNFAYNAYRDSVEDQRYEDQLAYEREQDTLATQQNSIGTTKPNLTAAQTLNAIKSGVINDTTMSAYEYYFGEPYGGTTGAVDTGKKTGGGSYNNGSLTTAQVKQLQKKLGVTADGMWGAKSKKAAGGLSADDAWKKFGNTVSNTVTGSDYWLGNGTTVGGKTSVSFDEDEGIFTWNGKNYNSITSMLNDIENANLTDSEMSTLKKKLSMYGFNLA